MQRLRHETSRMETDIERVRSDLAVLRPQLIILQTEYCDAVRKERDLHELQQQVHGSKKKRKVQFAAAEPEREPERMEIPVAWRTFSSKFSVITVTEYEFCDLISKRDDINDAIKRNVPYSSVLVNGSKTMVVINGDVCITDAVQQVTISLLGGQWNALMRM